MFSFAISFCGAPRVAAVTFIVWENFFSRLTDDATMPPIPATTASAGPRGHPCPRRTSCRTADRPAYRTGRLRSRSPRALASRPGRSCWSPAGSGGRQRLAQRPRRPPSHGPGEPRLHLVDGDSALAVGGALRLDAGAGNGLGVLVTPASAALPVRDPQGVSDLGQEERVERPLVVVGVRRPVEGRGAGECRITA